MGASKIARDISHAKRLERERAEALQRNKPGESRPRRSRRSAGSSRSHWIFPRSASELSTACAACSGGAIAVLYAVDSESGDLVAMTRAGPFAPRLGNDYRLRRGAGLVGLAIRERQPVVTTDVLQDARLWYSEDERELIERVGHRAACAIPLVIQDTVIGALGIG